MTPERVSEALANVATARELVARDTYGADELLAELAPTLAGHVEALAARVAELEAALRPLACVARWLPDGTDDGVYLGTQLRGVDYDVTPTVGDCRRAASLLAGKDGAA